MMGLNLSYSELVELTHFKISKKQVEALRFMGIEHRVRPDGSVAVLRSHVDRVMGGVESKKESRAMASPCWENINGKAA